MKRFLAAAAGLLGLAWWRSRVPQPLDDPADELRAKLAQARDADDRDEFEAGETPVDEIDDVDAVDVRRQDVHERARAAADELKPE